MTRILRSHVLYRRCLVDSVFVLLASTAFLLLASKATALSVAVLDPVIDVDGFDIYTFALDIPAGSENSFNTFELSTTGLFNQLPAGGDGSLVERPSLDSGFFVDLTAPATFGGQGLIAFGVSPTTDNTQGFSGTFVSLGSNAISNQGNYSIAQAVVPTGLGGSFDYGFYDAGINLSQGSGIFGGGPPPPVDPPPVDPPPVDPPPVSPPGTPTSAMFSISGPTPSPTGLDTYIFALDIPPGEEGRFGSFELNVVGDLIQPPGGGDGELLFPREVDDSGFFAELTAPTAFGGQALHEFLPSVSSDTNTIISNRFISLGNNNASTQGNYEVAQVVLPAGTGGAYSYAFYDNRSFDQVGSGTGSFAGGTTIVPPPVDPPPVDPPPVDPPPVDPPPVDRPFVFGGFKVEGPTASPSGLDTYLFSLDLPESLVGGFDTFELSVQGDLNQDPEGGDGNPIGFTSSDDSGFSYLLNCGTCFGGQGLSSFGVDASTDSPDGISGVFASLGSNDASSLGDYDVAQVVVPNGSDGTFQFAFFDDGVQVGGGGGTLSEGLQQPTVVVSELVLLEDGSELLLLLVDVPEGAAGRFDTIELVVEGDLSQNIQSGMLVSEGDQDSGFIDLLTAPTGFGGNELSAFGVDASTDTEAGIAGTFASLGSNGASEQGDFLIAQVVIPAGSQYTYSYAFFDNGVEVASGNAIRGFVPEPLGLTLMLLGCLNFCAFRRRKNF